MNTEVKPPSERHQRANEIAAMILELGIAEIYGVDVTLRKDPKPYYARYVDGDVKVYSPKFVVVSWETAFRTMPRERDEVHAV